MTQAVLHHQLRLLGASVLHVANQAPRALEGKHAALVAHLALEGRVSRSKLAGLLWPEVNESTARANLRQTLRRLRDAWSFAPVLGEEQLMLSPEIAVDAVQLELDAFAGNAAGVLHTKGELLAGLELQACPEFEEWLLAKRETFLNLRRTAASRLLEEAEIASHHRQALEYNQVLLELDPVSETAYRNAMRLHHLDNDRAAALQAFERCKKILHQELGVDPMPETLALFEAIAHNNAKLPMPQIQAHIPLEVLRPPQLVGREREWRQLEAAGQAQQLVVVTGEPGMGKTRLVLDFAGSLGTCFFVEGRPGDEAVPFSGYARALRQASRGVLHNGPTLQLPDWVRLEMARLLPELHESVPPALGPAQDKLRFFEALAQTILAFSPVCIVADDLQFMDAASLEAHGFLLTRFNEQPQAPRQFLACRHNEMPTGLAAQLEAMTSAGKATTIALAPFDSEAVAALCQTLGQTVAHHTQDFQTRLLHHTGGNPMFMLETIKHLLQNGTDAQHLPVPSRVAALVQQRLGRLSDDALRVAQLHAISAPGLGAEPMGAILGMSAWQLAQISQELEQQQIMVADRFVHDLIAAATLAGVPNAVQVFVHRQAATWLQNHNGVAAHIARHWIGANEAQRALPFLVRAAEDWLAKDVLAPAANLYQQAAEIATPNDPNQAFELWTETLNCLMDLDAGAVFENAVKRLFVLAKTPQQLVVAHTWQAEWCSIRGDHQGILDACERALLHTAPNTQEHASILEMQHVAFAETGEVAKALACLQTSVKIQTALGKTRDDMDLDHQFGILYSKLGQPIQAIAHAERSVAQETDGVMKVRTQNNMLLAHVELGKIRFARDALQEIWQSKRQHMQEARPRLVTLVNLGMLNTHLCEFDKALGCYQELEQQDNDQGFWKMGDHHRYKATTMFELGEYENAQEHLDKALGYGLPHGLKGSAWLLLARCQDQLGQDKREALRQAKTLMLGSNDKRMQRQFVLMQAEWLPPKKALPQLQEVLNDAQDNGAHSPEITALVRIAQTHLRLKQPQEAWPHIQAAVALLGQGLDSGHIRRNEIFWTQAQVSCACGHGDATQHLQTALSWLEGIVQNHMPAQHHDTYLQRNPHNRALLEQVKDNGVAAQW